MEWAELGDQAFGAGQQGDLLELAVEDIGLSESSPEMDEFLVAFQDFCDDGGLVIELLLVFIFADGAFVVGGVDGHCGLLFAPDHGDAVGAGENDDGGIGFGIGLFDGVLPGVVMDLEGPFDGIVLRDECRIVNDWVAVAGLFGGVEYGGGPHGGYFLFQILSLMI